MSRLIYQVQARSRQAKLLVFAFIALNLTSFVSANTLDSDVALALVGSNGHAEIPDVYTKIESNAFNGAASLTSVTIPNSVTSIGSNAFQNTALTSIDIRD